MFVRTQKPIEVIVLGIAAYVSILEVLSQSGFCSSLFPVFLRILSKFC